MQIGQNRYRHGTGFATVRVISGVDGVNIGCEKVMQAHPVFIMGSARSATSSLLRKLKTVLDYNSDDEGHFFPIFLDMMEAIDKFYGRFAPLQGGNTEFHGLTLFRIDRGHFKHELRKTLLSVFDDFFPKPWMDKTPGPEMIGVLPFLHNFLPEAKTIYVIRHGVDNINSRLRKFPNVSFEKHCREWVACDQEWKKVKPNLANGSFMELRIDQNELLTGDQVSDIVRFLRPDFAMDTYPTNKEIVRLEKTYNPADEFSWSDDEKQKFVEICGSTMAEYSFDYDFAADIERKLIVLNPPYGQNNIDIISASNMPVCAESHDGEVWIFMHCSDNANDKTTILYKDIYINQQYRFDSKIKCAPEAKNEIYFTCKIKDTENGNIIIQNEIKCDPGDEKLWSFNLTEKIDINADVIITSEVKNDLDNTCAWSWFPPPVLSVIGSPAF